MTANEIIIESRQEIIKAIQTEALPIELKIEIGKKGGIIRGFDVLKICSEVEINQIKSLIIAGIQREIDDLKKSK